MVYIVNLNPSIDYHLGVKDVKVGQTNRSLNESYLVGGKGINVAIVLNNLGINNNLTGYLGGFTGRYVSDHLAKYEKINDEFIEVEGNTRINLKIKTKGGVETEINGRGPYISKTDLKKLEAKLCDLGDGDVLVLSGSLSQNMPDNWYLEILKNLTTKNVKVIFDYASKDMLEALSHSVYLIKPNKHEFELMMGQKYEKLDDIIEAAQRLMEHYPKSRMMLSLGNQGSYFISSKHLFYAPIIEGEVVHTIGAGDSMIAGYLYGLVNGFDEKTRFKMAVSSATSSVLTGQLASLENFEYYLDLVEVREGNA